MSESFDFVVGFGTNFEQLEDLRREFAIRCISFSRVCSSVRHAVSIASPT